MNLANGFVTVMIVMQVVAMLAYIVKGQWNYGVYWFGAAVINGAVLWRAWS